jgi:protein-S-isoprenylcysteine O-methyltransferase Ste14
VAQSILMIAVIVLGVLFRGDWTRVPLIAAAAGLCALGGYLVLSGVAVLGRNRTPFPQPRHDSGLVRRGVYSRMRHPLYTGVMLALSGWALIWQSGPALSVALLSIPFFHGKARYEERALRKRFPEYAEYERRVPRFVPRLFAP